MLYLMKPDYLEARLSNMGDVPGLVNQACGAWVAQLNLVDVGLLPVDVC